MNPESFQLSIWDILIFVAFVVTVVSVGLYQSRSEKGSEDYFLAGRGLKWWLIGFSLIAANISTEQFVGMSGNAASHVGLAIASYEWMAAITLVVVAFAFLPYFLRAGIYTMPEFLEVRYNATARTIMAVATIIIYMLLLGSVTYSGALTISTLAGKAGVSVSLATGSLIIGVIAMVYVTAGGLKACAWADLIQGSALILGGAVIMLFAFQKLGMATEAASVVNVETGAVSIQALSPNAGAMERFWELNRTRMNMFLPATDTRAAVDRADARAVDSELLLLGSEPVHHAAHPGLGLAGRGAEGHRVRGVHEAADPVRDRRSGDHRLQPLLERYAARGARRHARGSLAKYLDANPATQFVETADAPTDEEIAAWPGGRYLLAIYPDDAAIEATRDSEPVRVADHPGRSSRLQSRRVHGLRLRGPVVGRRQSRTGRRDRGVQRAGERGCRAAGRSTTSEKLIAYKYDTALAQLLGNVLPQGVGVVGFVLAALLGAVVSSLAAMLNAASTIFSMDVFKKYIRPNASQG